MTLDEGTLLRLLISNLPTLVALIVVFVNLKNKAEQNAANIKQIKDHLGLGDKPNGGYVRRGECLLMEGAVKDKLEMMAKSLAEMRVEVHAQHAELRADMDKRFDDVNRRLNNG